MDFDILFQKKIYIIVFFFYKASLDQIGQIHSKYFNIPAAAVLFTRFKTFHYQLKFYSTSSLTFNPKFLCNCLEDGCLTFKLCTNHTVSKSALNGYQTRVDSDKPINQEFGLWFMDFGLLLWTQDDSGLSVEPLYYHKDSETFL